MDWTMPPSGFVVVDEHGDRFSIKGDKWPRELEGLRHINFGTDGGRYFREDGVSYLGNQVVARIKPATHTHIAGLLEAGYTQGENGIIHPPAPEPTLEERRLAWAREAQAKSMEAAKFYRVASAVRNGDTGWDHQIAAIAGCLADWRG